MIEFLAALLLAILPTALGLWLANRAVPRDAPIGGSLFVLAAGAVTYVGSVALIWWAL